MSKPKKPTQSIDLKHQLKGFGNKILAYRVFIFVIVIAGVYGFLIFRINTLSSAPPSESDLQTAEAAVGAPKISAAAVKKLESLQDNSVRVQTLFNDARNNPFKE